MTICRMTPTTRTAVAVAAVAGLGLVTPALAADEQVLIEADAFEYQAGPGSLAEGSRYTVLYGDPGTEGLFAMRLKLPDGFVIAPHSHERPEVVTVISGTFLIGHGAEADRNAATRLEPGGFFAFPAGMVHHAFAEGETVVQLNSVGPWTIRYVEQDDDPRS